MFTPFWIKHFASISWTSCPFLPPKQLCSKKVLCFCKRDLISLFPLLLSSIYQITELQFASPDVTWLFDQQYTIISTRRDTACRGKHKPQESCLLCMGGGNRNTFSMKTFWSTQSVIPKEDKYQHLLFMEEKFLMHDRNTDNSSLTRKHKL